MDFKKYETGLSCPEVTNFRTVKVFKDGKIFYIGNLTALYKEGGKTMRQLRNEKYLIEVADDEVEFEKAFEEYIEEDNKKLEQFKNELFSEFDVIEKEKRNECFEKARMYAQSGSFEDIYNEFSNLVELIK